MDSTAPALVLVAACVLVLVMLPALTRWIQRRTGAAGGAADPSARLLSALNVGPQQRVVTIEVGPAHGRTTLVLGVTQQAVTCLHAFGPTGASAPRAAAGDEGR
jgi:flagellar protein FliO/FliZ